MRESWRSTKRSPDEAVGIVQGDAVSPAAKILPGRASAPETQKGCKREGVSTVNLNHPLAANS